MAKRRKCRNSELILTPCCRIDRDAEISPGSGPSKLPPANPVNRSAWEYNQAATDFGNYRRDLKVLDGSGGQIPSISRHPPTATSPHPPNWSAGGNTPAQMPTSIFGSFYNDSEDELGQLSPGFRPGSANDNGFPADDRRPSVASATTVSSSGSKSSVGRNFHKKLQGFFGEEPPSDSRQNSEASLPHQPQPSNAQQYANRIRANSTNNTIGSSFGGGSRPASPTSSRPRTPLPSSEVTPWEFQDYQVSHLRSAIMHSHACPGDSRLVACCELGVPMQERISQISPAPFFEVRNQSKQER